MQRTEPTEPIAVLLANTASPSRSLAINSRHKWERNVAVGLHKSNEQSDLLAMIAFSSRLFQERRTLRSEQSPEADDNLVAQFCLSACSKKTIGV